LNIAWSETTRPRPSVWRPKFSNSATGSNRSRLFLQGAAPSKSRPMENCSIRNSSPATGPISTPSSARSKNSNNCARPSSSVVRHWTLDVERSPRRRPSRAETGWAFAFSCFRRVKGAWWPSRSSKPLSVRKSRGRFDSCPLRQFKSCSRPAVLGRSEADWHFTATERRGYSRRIPKGGERPCPANKSVG
jgi:hypothetical protein